MNDATHYIDGSQIYGSDEYTASTLRSYTNGTLKSVTKEDDFQESCSYSSIGPSSGSNKTYSPNSGKIQIFNTLHYAILNIIKCAVAKLSKLSYRQLGCQLESRNGALSRHVFKIPQLCSIEIEKCSSPVVRRNIVPRISENHRCGHSTHYILAVLTDHSRYMTILCPTYTFIQ